MKYEVKLEDQVKVQGIAEFIFFTVVDADGPTPR